MRRWLISLSCLSVTVALAGCSSSGSYPSQTSMPSSSSAPNGSHSSAGKPSGTAEAAFRRWVQAYSDGQYDRMWQSLASQERAFVPESRFMSCRAQTVNNVGINTISYDKTTANYASDVQVPGTTKTVHSTAITAQLTVNGSHTTRVTAHWFAEGGAWHWSLDQNSVDAYKAGHCPAP